MLRNTLLAITFLGAVVPIFPTEIQHAEYKETLEVPAFATSDGFLADNQYADNPDGTYYIRGNDGSGLAVSTTTLDKTHTEKVAQTGFMYLNNYKKLLEDTIYTVITEDKADYERLRTRKEEGQEDLKPEIKERQSLLELAFSPVEVKAGIVPDNYSYTTWSVATASVTFAHVVTSADTLIVEVGIYDAGNDVAQSATYNSVSLTSELATATTTHNGSIWYLTSPSTGSNNVFVDLASGAGTADRGLVVVQSLSGVDPADVFDTSQAQYGQATTTVNFSHVAGGIGIDMLVSSDLSITANHNTFQGTRFRYFDSGSFTFYSHVYHHKYSGKNCSVASQDGTPTGIFFKDDGTKMYVIGSANDTIYQYSLSTAWDPSTCSYDSVSLSVNAQDSTPQDLAFKTDGTKLYFTGSSNDRIYQYSCSSAWSVSSCTYDSVSTTTSPGEGVNETIFFKPDGSSLFIAGTTLDAVQEYVLGSAWDISSASVGSSFTIPVSDGSNPADVEFTSDGVYMVVLNPATSIQEYYLSTAWNVSTASNMKYGISREFLTRENNTGESLYLKDRNTLYFIGTGGDTAYTYEVNTATTTTTMTLDNPGGNEIYTFVGGILKPYVAPAGGGGGIFQDIIWFNQD